MSDSKGIELRLGIVAPGVSGTIYQTNRVGSAQHAPKDVGIETKALQKLLRTSHDYASLHGVGVQRRKLDSTSIKHQSSRPP